MSIENEYEDRCPSCPRACPQEAPGCPRGEAWAASLSGEEGEIRKHLRLNRELRLLRQIPFRKTEKIYILEKPAI